MKIKKTGIVICCALTVILVLVSFLVHKWNKYILPYDNIDVASVNFLDIDNVKDYELIKHYTDTIQYNMFRKPIPVFLVDIIYDSDFYEEKKMYETERRNISFEFEIDDFTGMVVSESNDKTMKAICFCDELKTIRYIAIYYKDFRDLYDDIDSFEDELDVCLYGIGCKWNITEMKDKSSEETIPEKILWQKSSIE